MSRRRRRESVLGKAEDPHSPSHTVHGEGHRRPAEDARRIRSGERGYWDPHTSKVAREPPYNQGEEAKWRNCCVIGSLLRKGEQGGTELSQERHQGGRGVVPSRNVQERRT